MKLFLLLSGLLISQWGFAQESRDTISPVPEPRLFVSKHETRLSGEVISYTATAGETHLKNKDGDPVASIWSVAYTRNESKGAASRPVMFIFNGGPGSASVWLHMGLFGPKLVQVPSEADADDGAAPFPIIDNPYGLLDLTDLVFIDPVGTGFSKVIGKGKAKDFWGLNEDARSVAQFIRQWVTKNQRWNSPKYIAGESFGTMRAVTVTRELEGNGQSLAVNGLILISQALDYAGSTSEHDNITSYLTYFPSMAATAWYHKKAGAGQDLKDFVEEARQFTINDYAPALYWGSLLGADQRASLVERIHYFTGLDHDYIDRSNLRVLVPRFQKELLRQQGLTIGRLDGRYFAEEADQVAERPTLGDAASFSIGSAYTAALHQHLAQNLKVTMDRPYLTSNSALYPKWNWRPVPKDSGWEPSYPNVARQLGNAMRRNKDLYVLVANGYYDLITPFFDAEYTFARNGIRMDRVEMKYYEAGHMMYTHQPDLEKVAQDIRTFLTKERR